VYLSRLTLNPRNRLARTDTANPYEMHRTLARILEPETNYLWRLEDTVLLVQSESRPDWGQLEPGYLASPSESKAFELEKIGMLERPLRFRLSANPTVTKFDPAANKNKRHGITDLEAQLEWLKRQGSSGGFEILGAMVSQSERRRIRKAKSEHSITLQVVTFDGHLRVTDANIFTKTLSTGLGHSKALGLGLLSVALGH
jgi:CRISPR system Cascade subunit CasE